MVLGIEIEGNAIVDRNPATGEVIERVPCTPLDEIPSIVKKSQIAQPVWFNTPLLERVETLKKALAALKVSEICKQISEEVGKLKIESEEEMSSAMDQNTLFNLIMEANSDVKKGSSTLVRDPHGVVVIFSPWNFPVSDLLMLALPALGAGNAIIVKPSEATPLVGKLVVDAFQSVLPDGVVQLVQGGSYLEETLVKCDGVGMIAMTGSIESGRNILKLCASDLKKVVLELGGKDSMVIFAETPNPDKAVQDAVLFSLYNSGQVSGAIERIYVDKSIKDFFEQKVIEMAKNFSEVAPLITSHQKQRVEAQVKEAIDLGACLLYQSDVTATSDCFYPITVLTNVKHSMTIAQEETFGPVICIMSFDGTEDNAVDLVNDCQYGFGCHIYTLDKIKAKRMARKIKAGQIGINCYSMLYAASGCPWVGHKKSGYGFVSGIEGLQQFSLPKSIVLGR